MVLNTLKCRRSRRVRRYVEDENGWQGPPKVSCLPPELHEAPGEQSAKLTLQQALSDRRLRWGGFGATCHHSVRPVLCSSGLPVLCSSGHIPNASRRRARRHAAQAAFALEPTSVSHDVVLLYFRSDVVLLCFRFACRCCGVLSFLSRVESSKS